MRQFLILLLAAAVAAQDTPEQAAAKVIAAANDAAELQALAQRKTPDPWLVADELCFRGEHDAAAAFAKATGERKLPAYVAAARTRAPRPEARRAHAQAQEAFANKDAAGALKLLQAVERAEDLITAQVLLATGVQLRALRQPRESAATFRAAAELADKIGWLRGSSIGWYESGLSSSRAGDLRGAGAAWQRFLEVQRTRRDRLGEALALTNLGTIARKFGKFDEALALQQRSLAIQLELEDPVGAAGARMSLANTYQAMGKRDEALATMLQAFKEFEAAGARQAMARALNNIGISYKDRGDYAAALDAYRRSLELKEELKDRRGAGTTLGNIGVVYKRLGNYHRAIDYQQRALESARAFRNRTGEARALANLGILYRLRGDYSKALDCLRKAGAFYKKTGNRAATATLANIGLVHWDMGEYSRALSAQERAWDLSKKANDRPGIARCLNNIGLVYENLGDLDAALDFYQRALEVKQVLKDRSGIANSLLNIGNVQMARGDREAAMASFERARELLERGGNVGTLGRILGTLGNAHRRNKEYEKAIALLEKSLAILEEAGERGGAAVALSNLGLVHALRGNHDKALAYLERSIALAERIAARNTLVRALFHLAELHLARGETQPAIACTRRAIAEANLLVGGLGDELGTKGRERWQSLFAIGIQVAIAQKDPKEAWFFLESGRAGALLEALGGREKLQALAMPAALRSRETAARGDEAAALTIYRRALSAGGLKEIQQRKKELDAARENTRAVVARIQREAKAEAQLLYPTPDALGDVQAVLRPNEALLSYAVFQGGAAALVVTAKDTRLVQLGATPDIEQACAPLRAPAGPEVNAAIQKLRALVIDPLKLSQKTTRLLVSPHGVLSYVPFALLANGREVAYVPSGSTYRLLTQDRALRGTRVLAVGNPDRGARRVRQLRGDKLGALPGAEEEARRVGDEVLVKEAATETRIARALEQEERWRAVHFACHGLIDPERPVLSSLALIEDEKNDGLLTVLDLYRMRIPTDLVVLSACETARGKIYQAEGVVGFTRAFMFAGAPRVICSLWKVDDKATRALMVKFYELWKTEPTATALQKAQEFVASQEKWKHPSYWAAWQLWGLPD